MAGLLTAILPGGARADAKRLSDPSDNTGTGVSHAPSGPRFGVQPALLLNQASSPPFTVIADASTSRDTTGFPIASFLFNFGDGSPIVATNSPNAVATHTYAGPGYYTVTITLTDTDSDTSSAVSAGINVVAPDYPPLAHLGVTQLASPPLTVNADASGSTDTDATPIASYQFDFGDGSAVVTTTAPTATAQHTYATPGNYTVLVTVTDSGGLASSPASAPITVLPPDQPPVAHLSVTQLASPPLTVNADGSASTDTDPWPIATYHFDFGDGSAIVNTTAPTATAQHTYSAAGQYVILLTATDTNGLTSATARDTFTVLPPDQAPVARLSVTQLASPPLSVNADGSASTDTDPWPIATYHFDFGDGSAIVNTTAPTATAQHTYSAAGQYVILLTATDTNGLTSATARDTFTVLPPDQAPVARLSVTQLASPPLTVNADGSTSTDTDPWPIATYHFDFGDGSAVVNTTAPTAAAQHTYSAAGQYILQLTATDTKGLTSSTALDTFTVTPPDNAPVAHLTVTQLAAPTQTVNADGSTSTDTDLTPIATYHFDFGDGSAVVNTTAPTATAQHTYASPGNHTVTLTATDAGGLTSAPVQVTRFVNPPSIVMERGVAQSSDDAEEMSGGSVLLTGSDLDFGNPSVVVAMRWLGINIPRNSTITAAWIQFNAQLSQSDAASLTVHAQAAASPVTFASSSSNLSSRPLTTASAIWTPPAWTSGGAGTAQRTADLSPVIQEIVNRADWLSGYPLAILISGSGDRTAYSDDASNSKAPIIHIEYLPPEAAPVVRLNAIQVQPGPLTVWADGSSSADSDATPIASYTFNFGDGSPAVVTAPPTSTAQHTYAAAGNYTVTLTVTDIGNQTSSPVNVPLNVTNGGGATIAVFGGYYDTHHAGNTQPKPNPWRGSANTTFIGTQDNQSGDPPGGGWDTSCIRIDNLTSGALSNVTVTCDMGTHHYALWGTNSIAAGTHLVLAQTAFENFDGSDDNTAACYGCDPTLCVTQFSTALPVVHVTIGGTTADYTDSRQIMNTHGVDGAGCPYIGGQLPQTRYDESSNWVQIYTSSGNGLAAQPAPPGDAKSQPAAQDAAPRVLKLSPAAPNPARGGFTLTFELPRQGTVRLGLFDVSGRLVKSLMDTMMEPGIFNVQADLSHTPAGVYFVRLWTAQESRLEKVIVVR